MGFEQLQLIDIFGIHSTMLPITFLMHAYQASRRQLSGEHLDLLQQGQPGQPVSAAGHICYGVSEH